MMIDIIQDWDYSAAIMEITKLKFKGSVDEFTVVAHLFENEQTVQHQEVGGRTTIVTTESSIPGATVFKRDIDGRTQDDYQRLLTRRPISKGQQQIFKAVYDSAGGLTAAELEKSTGRSKAELPGMMGALGKRVNATPGIGQDKKPGICLLFKVSKLDNGAGQWHYEMRPELREALEDIGPTWLHSSVD